MQQIDPTAFPPDHPTAPVAKAVKSIRVSTKYVTPIVRGVQTALDDGSLIDVMVVYTPSARISEGGTAGMLSRINLVVAETNNAYLNSGVVQRIRLVYAGEVNYTETTLSPDLDRLQNPTDGFMDEVHALRNLYGADLVSLWGNYPSGGGCGQSRTMLTEDLSFENQAFTVVDRNCAASNYSFAHELGHNMGLLHDDAGSPTSVTPEGSPVGTMPISINYARGYADATNLFRTVMAVTNICPNCTRIPYFSNPANSFNGAPTGSGIANARQALNDTRDSTANFRLSVNLAGPGTIVFSPATYSVPENVGSVTISATRHAGSAGAVSVHYLSSGTAKPDVDYDSLSATGILNWADGESGSKTFAITIFQTTAVSSPNIIVSLDTPTGGVSIGAAGFSSTVTVNIIDSPQTGAAQITSAAPPGGFLNIPYSYKVVASGAPTILYQLKTDQTLPTGLTLNLNTGNISGTPTSLGTFTGFIRAFNGQPGNIPGPGEQFFSIAIVGAPPSPPTITSAIAGDTQASITFNPSSSQGSAQITNYTVTCNPGAHTATGLSSPIDVTGLTNGTQYSCSVSATNFYGTVVSSTLVVTPILNAAIALVAVKSRKFHGAAGAQFLTIDASALIGGNISIEPRGSGSAGHTIVFYFNGPIASLGLVTAKDAIGTSFGTVSASRMGNTVEVTLLGAPDNKRVTITLPGVNGNATNFAASLGFLVGDVNNNHAVNASDISAVKAHANQATTEANFKFDLNASGSVDAADVSAVKARAGLVLP